MRSIRSRLMVTLLAGLAAVLIAGGAAVYWTAESGLERQFDATLGSTAHVLASLVKLEPEGLVFETDDAPAVTLAETYFEFRTRSGEVLKRSNTLEDDSLPRRDPPADGIVFEHTPLPDQIHGRAVWFAFVPRVDPDDWEGVGDVPAAPEELVLAVAMNRAPIDRALSTLLWALIVVGAIVGATVAGLVAFGVRWGLLPLARLRARVEAISGETMSRRLESDDAPTELMPVYLALNDMLGRVAQTLERERSFADGAAHELRTPLAELRTTAEVALRWPDATRTTAALKEALAIGGEIERLVESLLLISRGNAADFAASATAAPVASIIDPCLRHARAAIDAKQLQVSINLDVGATLTAPADALQIIARNLIDNAVQYTPAGGRLTIGIEPGVNGSPSLVVSNGPVTLCEADLPRLFEPFWRTDGARADRNHVGLGLTVVQRIAQAVNLRVDAGLEDDTLRIRVSHVATDGQQGQSTTGT